MYENVPSDMSAQRRLKSACASAHPRISDVRTNIVSFAIKNARSLIWYLRWVHMSEGMFTDILDHILFA